MNGCACLWVGLGAAGSVNVSHCSFYFRFENEPDLFEPLACNQLLPRFLVLKKGGFASVLYDNFSACSADQSAIDELVARATRNMKLFEIVVKDGTKKTFGNKLLRRNLTILKEEDERLVEVWMKDPLEAKVTLPIHLGVDLCILEVKDLRLAWRVDPLKLLKWKADQVLYDMTARQYARFVGRIIWAHSLSLSPLYDIEEVLEVARELGTYVGTQYRKWDDRIQLTHSQVEKLADAWKDTLMNPWMTNGKKSASTILHLYTDASDDGWAYVLSDDRKCLGC